MRNRLSLRLLIRLRAPIGVASVAVIILYFIYWGILRLGIITPLGSDASFNVITRIINFTFILALTTVTLSIISYTLPKILPAKFFAPLDPTATASLLTKVVNLGFILVVTATIFGAISYTLPKVLPPSFFEPLPKIEYATAIAKMFDPYEVSRSAQLLDRMEIYPGFPYYSRASDHPTLWPVRVSSDREALFLQYEAFIGRYAVEIAKALAASQGDKAAKNSFQILGGGYSPSERAKIETILALRSWFYNTLAGDPQAAAQYLGQEGAAAFLRVEEARHRLRQHFPNRIAFIRIKNAGKRDARNVTVDFDLFGELYDIAINADPTQVHKAEYDRAKKRLVIEQVMPGSLSEIQLWYRYYSVKNRVFPDERDFILELTQGLVINNIAVSNGIATLNKELMHGFSAYECLYIGAAVKKDNYASDLAQYFEKQNQAYKKTMERYDQEHPSFKNVSPAWLAESSRPDASVNAVWVSFVSKAGKAYKAVHVFHHSKGPYILLSSKDKDREDFKRVEAGLAQAYQGTPEGQISERIDDICTSISVKSGFTQKGVAEQVDQFFRSAFERVAIEAVYY
jgi:hypothetical protein